MPASKAKPVNCCDMNQPKGSCCDKDISLLTRSPASEHVNAQDKCEVNTVKVQHQTHPKFSLFYSTQLPLIKVQALRKKLISHLLYISPLITVTKTHTRKMIKHVQLSMAEE